MLLLLAAAAAAADILNNLVEIMMPMLITIVRMFVKWYEIKSLTILLQS